MPKNANVNSPKETGYVPAAEASKGAGFTVVDDGGHDVAMAYALLSDGTVPPVIRGDQLEDY